MEKGSWTVFSRHELTRERLHGTDEPSQRLFSRRRGFALVSALVLALLFLALIELLLADLTQASRTAERVRGRILADILAENGVELVVRDMVTSPTGSVSRELDGGRVVASYEPRANGAFTIRSESLANGPFPARAALVIEGRITGPRVRIVRSHTTPGGDPLSPTGTGGNVTLKR